MIISTNGITKRLAFTRFVLLGNQFIVVFKIQDYVNAKNYSEYWSVRQFALSDTA
jgi:hypothetical protein